jgi:hypothetical protein
LETGDVLVAGWDGVRIVRGNKVVSHPVTSPVESAFSDGFGGIVFITPDPYRFPDEWPTSSGGGGYVIWRAFPDGTLGWLLSTGPIKPGGPVGKLTLYQVGLIDPEVIAIRTDEEPVPFVVFSLYQSRDHPDGPFLREELWMLAFYEGGIYPGFTVGLGRPDDGDRFTGAGWHGSRVIVSIAGDRGGWLEAWEVFGDPDDYPVEQPAEWPTNPYPPGTPCPDASGHTHCVGSVATLPGTELIAYIETDSSQAATNLIVVDTETGTELRRVRVAGVTTAIKLVQAGRDEIVISPMTFNGYRWVHLPGIVIDIETGATRQLPVPGVATIVP